MSVQSLKSLIATTANNARARRALFKYDLNLALRDWKNSLLGRTPPQPVICSRVPVRTIRKFMKQRGLAFWNGDFSWWYTWALERGDTDPITNYAVGYLRENVPKDAPVLVTGCGTGIELFHFLESGFTRVEGFDCLQPCVDVANDVAKAGGYNTRVWLDDGFKPQGVTGTYDAILAHRWLFTAWGGNYGNAPIPLAEAKTPAVREKVLTDFLSQYAPHLNAGGIIIFEVCDAVADYRISPDYGRPDADKIFAVRQTPEQVKKCAALTGFDVVDYKMTLNNPNPTTCYILRKRA